MRIVLDAMGGDLAPAEVVKGAVEAAREHRLEVTLVGRQREIEAELARYDAHSLPLSIIHAEEVIAMGDRAVASVREKKRSSLVVGLHLVKEGAASGFVSAGNSGAAMAAAIFVLGRTEGVERPAIATLYPTLRGQCLIIDVGANVDCKPSFLVQFAAMGQVYMQRVAGLANPTVGLLSNGEEQSKGNQLVLEAHRLLRNTNSSFIGNIEGKDIPAGAADVVVCDGFSGNVVLKLSEGLAETILKLIKEELSRDPVARLAALVLGAAFSHVRRRIDYTEYGGAPLLGVNGVCIMAHGRSNAKAIKNALLGAERAAQHDLVRHIRDALAVRGAGSPE